MQDCELLYLSDRPEKLLVTSIPVPPIAIRPSVFVDGGTQRSDAAFLSNYFYFDLECLLTIEDILLLKCFSTLKAF